MHFCALAPVCILTLTVSALAQQSDRARTEALARRATERLQALQREADRLASDEQTLLGDLRKLEVERQIKAERFRDVDAQWRHVGSDLTGATDRVHQLEQRDLAERPGLRARLIDIYKLGQGGYLRLLLSTADLRGVGRASRTVATLAELDRRRLAEHQRTLDELKAKRDDLQARRHQLEKLRADAQRAQAAVEQAAAARDDLIRDIDRRRDLNAQLAGELQMSQQKLQAALRDLAGGATTEGATLPLRPFRGDLPWPVDGSVRRRFGWATAGRGAASNGMEIAAVDGAVAHAVHDGVVAFADRFGGFGNLVIVDHGSQAYSLYGNLLDIGVNKGTRVEHGQAVGTVGPSPTGPPGLYFELRVDGQPVDPLQWLKKR